MAEVDDTELALRKTFCAALEVDSGTLVAGLVADVESRIPDYEYLAKSLNDRLLGENALYHLDAFRRLLIEPDMDISAVSALARKTSIVRAEQGLPVQMIVRTYQIFTQRFWTWIIATPRLERQRQHAIQVCWPLWLEYVYEATRSTADAYVEWDRERVATSSISKQGFIDNLLRGTLTSIEAARWLERLGYDRPHEFLVLALRWPDNENRISEMATRVFRHLIERLPASHPRPIETIRGQFLVLLLPDPKVTPQTLVNVVSECMDEKSSGTVLLSGAVSNFFSDLAQFTKNLHETETAARAARSDHPIALVSELHLLDRALDSFRHDFASHCPAHIRSFVKICRQGHPEWIPTVLAWVESAFNARAAAEVLYVHANTVHYRLGQIQKETGLDLHTFADAGDALVAIRLIDELDE